MTKTTTTPRGRFPEWFDRFGRPPLPKTLDRALVEQLTELALRYDSDVKVFDAVGPVKIVDGYAARPLNLVDCREVVTHVRHSRSAVKAQRVRLEQESTRLAELEALLTP